MKKRKVTIPHMGNYYAAFSPLVELLGDEMVVPPPITKKTIEIGLKHSPESACIPFKYNLGNYIEALDMGANVLIQSGGGCRFGYYLEVQAEILKKLGYKFECVKLPNNFSFPAMIKNFKDFNPRLTYFLIIKKSAMAVFRLRAIDAVEEYIRKNIGFEEEDGSFENILREFIGKLKTTETVSQVNRLKRKFIARSRNVKINKPDNPIRVAVIGELYVLMEPFSNFNLEKELAKKKIEVHRFCTVSGILYSAFSFGRVTRRHIRQARPYLRYHIGAHGTESVGLAHELIKDGFDGLIHIKPFGCMPEVNAMSALHKMSKDYKFPIIYFSYDSQTSETGVKTRLEAFYDMLIMKNNNKNNLK